MTGPSITIQPVGFHARAGQSVTITVSNYGNKSINVAGTPTVIQAIKDSCQLAAAPNALTFAPARFVLPPNGSRRVLIHVNSEPSPHIGALFVATANGGNGNAHISAGVTAQITIQGQPLECSSGPKPATIPWLFIIIPLALIAVVASVIATRIIRRRVIG